MALQNRADSENPGGIYLVRINAAVARFCVHNQSLQFHQERSCALGYGGIGDSRRKRGSRAFGDEETGRILDALKAGVRHCEDTDLINRSEAVLGSPDESDAHGCLLEVQNGIDHVLYDLRACEGSFFCHVSDEENSSPHGLAETCDLHAAVPDLRHGSGDGRKLVGSQSLQRVYHCNLGFLRLYHGHDPLQFRFTENIDSFQLESKSFGSLADLAGAFLSGYVEYLAP